jgi:hypothetical protein
MTHIVVRMMTVSDATTWSITYDRQNNDCNVLIVQSIEFKRVSFKQKLNSHSNTNLS